MTEDLANDIRTALRAEGRAVLAETAGRCAYVDLSSDDRFGELFLKNVNF